MMPCAEQSAPLELPRDRLPVAIGAHIRAWRMVSKLRLLDIADRTGLTTRYIEMIEQGARMPTLQTICAIADALGVKASVLLDASQTPVTLADALEHALTGQPGTAPVDLPMLVRQADTLAGVGAPQARILARQIFLFVADVAADMERYDLVRAADARAAACL